MNLLRTALAAGVWIGSATFALAQSSQPIFKIAFNNARDALATDASIEIATPPAVVWKVITDCARAPKFVPNMQSCRIIRPGAEGPEVIEIVMNHILIPRIRTTVRMGFESAQRMTFARIEGDMRVADGAYRLEPLSNGKATRVSFNGAFALGFPVPRFIMQQVGESLVPAMMKAIERESLADAAKG